MAGFIDVDTHGKTVEQAQIAIDAALRRAGAAYRLRVIHGFNSGTAIRDMVYYKYKDNEKVLRVIPGDNPGVTVLVLRELYG